MPNTVRTVIRIAAVLLGALAAMQPALAWQQLRLHEIQQRPLVWPDTVATTVPLAGGGETIEEGTEVAFKGIENGAPLVQFPGDDGLAMLAWDMIDFVERANAIAASMDPAIRDLTLDDLTVRTDLWPAVVRLNQTAVFAEGAREAGRDVGPYRLIRFSPGSYGIIGLDPDILATGVLSQRQSYPLEVTDFLNGVRAKVRDGAPDATGLVAKELAGRLVNSAGEPAPDPDAATQYYLFYSSAAWCGWCAKFNPTLVKALADFREEHPEALAIYLSNDTSEAEMLGHLTEAGLDFPAVAFDERMSSRYLLGLFSGSTPHVVVLRADGRIVHDGNPAGMNGANAALAALRRELAQRPQ
jgi:hypothetical protein